MEFTEAAVGIGLIFCITGLQLWVPQIVQAMGFSDETVGVVVAVPFVCATAAMASTSSVKQISADAPPARRPSPP